MKKRIDWNSITPEQWSLGHSALATLLGVSRQRVFAASARIREGASCIPGRPRMAVPEILEGDTAKALAERHHVSLPTAQRWMRERRKSIAGAPG